MKPRFETIPEMKFAGERLTISFAENRTRELWQTFMPRRREIAKAVGTELYSMEVYPPGFFEAFDPNAQFEKWAAVEVSSFDDLPKGLETLTAPACLYAVFLHRGPASEAIITYTCIFQTWLPASEYRLDDRPHFAVMGEKYKNEDPDSERRSGHRFSPNSRSPVQPDIPTSHR
jgi:AraC family transcriptional regulator